MHRYRRGETIWENDRNWEIYSTLVEGVFGSVVKVREGQADLSQ